MRRSGTLSFAAAFGLAASALLAAAVRADPDPPAPSEAEVKAAFILNFAKFVEWPESGKAAPDDPVVFGVYGDRTLQESFEQVVSGKAVHGRKLVVKTVHDASEARRCHVLFLSGDSEPAAARLLAELDSVAVLTVGEDPGFIDRGGTIGFVPAEKKLRFEINLGAARRRGLDLSSKLLALADRVIREEPRAER